MDWTVIYLLYQLLFFYLVFVSAVELQNGQIVSKSGGENEEMWRPWTPRCVHTFSSHDMFIFMCQLCQNVLT